MIIFARAGSLFAPGRNAPRQAGASRCSGLRSMQTAGFPQVDMHKVCK